MIFRDLNQKNVLLPLTEIQKDMYAAIILQKCDYLVTNTLDLEEAISVPFMHTALEEVMKNQAALCSVFKDIDKLGPVQVVLSETITPFYIDTIAPKPDLETEPWNLSWDSKKLKLTFQYCHIVMDGWSMSLFWRLLLNTYYNISIGKELLPFKAKSLRAYHQLRNKSFNISNASSKFWECQLPEELCTLGSVLKKSGNPVKELNNQISFELSDEIISRLLSVAAELHVTPGTIYIAAWLLVLSFFTGQKKVSTNVVLSGRSQLRDYENTIGMFIQIPPFSCEIPETLPELCHLLRLYFENEEVNSPVVDAICSTIKKRRNKNNTIDTIIAIENYPFDSSLLDGKVLKIRHYSYFESPSAPFIITIAQEKQVQIKVMTAEEQYKEHLPLLLHTYVSILSQIGKRILNNNDFEFVSLHTIPCRWGDIVQDYIDKTLIDFITDACLNYSNQTAIVDGKSDIKYKEIFKYATQIAANLQALGIQKGECVGVALPRSIPQLLSVYSIILAGGVYVPLGEMPIQRVNDVISQANIRFIISVGNTKQWNCVQVTFDDLCAQTQTLKHISIQSNDTAYILFTSGSTGHPKGCIISHGAIVNRLTWNCYKLGLTRDFHQAYKTPISFDVSLIEIFSIFFAGHTLYILPENDEKYPDKILNFINTYSISYIHFVPSMLKNLYNYVVEFHESEKLHSLSLIVCSGEILTSDLVKNVRGISVLDQCRFVNLYGPTEAAVDVSFFDCSGNEVTYEEPIGTPIWNTGLLILNNLRQELPVLTEGILYIQGKNLGNGYINSDEMNHEYFITLNDGTKSYKTGDLAYRLQNGEIVVTGRADGQVKHNGVRIECNEIECKIKESGLYKDACVFVIQREYGTQLVACCVGENNNEIALRSYLEKVLSHNMLPNNYLFVPTFPFSPHGKINRNALIKMYQTSLIKETCNSELTELERELSCIWNKVLGTTCKYKKNDNFFAVGGTSILLIQILIEIQKKWNVKVASASIYNEPTLFKIEQALLKDINDRRIHHEYMHTDVSSQIHIFTYCQTHPESTAYNMPILMELTDAYDSQKVSNALMVVMSSCGFFRKRYKMEAGLFQEYYADKQPNPIGRVLCKEEELETHLRFLIKPFDMNEQLVRIAEIITGKHNYIFVDIHHILCDQSVIKYLLVTFKDIMEGKSTPQLKKVESESFKKTIIVHENEKDKKQSMLLLSDYTILLPKFSGKLGHHSFSSDLEISERINSWCQKHSCTPFQFLYSVFILFCGRAFQKKEVAVATTTTADCEFDSEMTLKIMLPHIIMYNASNFLSILEQVKDKLTLSMKQEESTSALLYDVMFVWDTPVLSEKELHPYFKSIQYLGKMAKNPLTLFCIPNTNNFTFSFDYDKGYFEEEAVHCFADSYIHLISIICKNDINCIFDDIYISPNTLEMIKNNASGKSVLTTNNTIQELFVKQCMQFPNNTIIEYDNISVSAEYFLKRCTGVAHTIYDALQTFHYERIPLVGVLMESGYDYLTAIMGILLAGAAFVPLDPHYPRKRNIRILKDNQIHICISDQEPENEILWISPTDFTDSTELLSIPSDIAYCIFTSGTTGEPKGCLVSQSNIINYVAWAEQYYCHDLKQCFAFFTSPAVDMTITSTLLPLVYGHKIIVFRNEAESFLTALSNPNITILKVTPSHLRMLKNDFCPSAKLNTLIVGGEQLTTVLASSICGILGSSVDIFNEYGPTESTVGCMIYKYNPEDSFISVPIGFPIQNMRISILNERGDPCLPNTIGEICLEGKGVISGYLNAPKQTDKYFTTSQTSHIYRTGDFARCLIDGRVLYEGRRDSQLKINGFRVELSEISTVAESFREIFKAQAIINNNHLILFCVPKTSHNLSEVIFRKFLYDNLPKYMIPSQIIMVDAIPLAKTGKVDFEALIKLIQSHGKEKNDKTMDDKSKDKSIINYVRFCWEEELQRNDFDIESGFIEVGGSSISIISLRERLARLYPFVTTADLFCYPSIRTQAEFIETKIQKRKIIPEYYNDSSIPTRIAITGIAFRLPELQDLGGLYNFLVSGNDCFHILSGKRRDDECKRLHELGFLPSDYRFARAASLNRIDLFDYKYFRIGYDEACAMDPAHRILISTMDDALNDAGYTKDTLKGKNCAVILSTPTDIGFRQYINTVFPVYSQNAPVNVVSSSLAGRIQFAYDMHGPAFLMDCACSTGLAIVHTACNLIMSGQCKMALVGGINLLDTVDYKGHSQASVLSPHYYAAPFSSIAEGTSRGEGCICFVLEDYEQAINDHHPVYAIIRGSAMNNDGFSSSLTAPNGKMQEQVLKDAWFNAKVTSEDLNIIETHGTATKLGDQIEIESLCRAASDSTVGHCALSSAKALFGHLDSISGLLGILKCIASIQYGLVFPTNRYFPPLREINWISSPFYIPNEVIQLDKKEIICGVSSFGLSGTNVHMVLSGFPNSVLLKPYHTRLQETRCWLPDIPENPAQATKSQVLSHVEQHKVFHEDEIIEHLTEKIASLYGENAVKIQSPLYLIGFDSVSIIQLKLFIKSTYNCDIEVTTKDTISDLAKQIALQKPNKKTEINNKFLENTSFSKDSIIFNSVSEINEESDSWYHLQIRNAFEQFFKAYLAQTRQSRKQMLDPALYWANGRFMTGYMRGMEQLSYPILAKHAKGADLWDIDGNHYIDFAMGFGSIFFGYNHPYIANKVAECLTDGIILGSLMQSPFSIAERICKMTGLDRVSFCNSGTEAIMNLIRIARAVRGCNKIVIFAGAFHGTFDPVYVQKNKWEESFSPIPRSLGTPLHYINDIVMLPYGLDKSIKYILDHANELAAVLVEPVQSRHPDLQPIAFVQELRKITEEKSIPLIFDEVITGFRCGLRGAQAFYGITADLVAYGKIIGGGYPLGVFGGKRQYMDILDHKGGLTHVGKMGKWVSTGGTFNGHPATMAAAGAVLDLLEKDSTTSLYKRVNSMTDFIVKKLNRFFEQQEICIRIEHFYSLFIFTGNSVYELRLLQYLLIHHGIFVWEGGTCFVSTSHTWKQIKVFIETVKKCVIFLKQTLPKRDLLNIRVSERIIGTDYPILKQLVEKIPDIREISPLCPQLYSVLTHNIAHHNLRQDIASITIHIHHSIEPAKIKQGLEYVLNAHKHLKSSLSWRRLLTPVYLTSNHINPIHNYYEFSSNIDMKLVEEVKKNRKQKGFVLEKAPLVIFDSFHTYKETILVMTYYNSWFDGWSADELIFEILNYALKDIKPISIFNWEKYSEWKELNHKKVKSYWQNKSPFFDSTINLPDKLTNWYEIRIPFSKKIINEINKYCKKCKITKAITYLYLVSLAFGKEWIWTSISGRNIPIEGIISEIGMFSGLVPLKIESPSQMQTDLDVMATLPICDMMELSTITGCKINDLSNGMATSTIVVLNQTKINQKNIEIIDDKSYVFAPCRCYISLDHALIITADECILKKERISELMSELEAKLSNLN